MKGNGDQVKKKGFGNWMISFGCTSVIIVMLSLWRDGIPCNGLPDSKDIVRVEITNTRISEEAKVYTDEEKIELARKAANFLNYRLGTVEAAENKSGFITIRYEEADGTVTEISADEATVFWKGKARELKDDETFVNLVEGIFFLDDIKDLEEESRKQHGSQETMNGEGTSVHSESVAGRDLRKPGDP